MSLLDKIWAGINDRPEFKEVTRKVSTGIK